MSLHTPFTRNLIYALGGGWGHLNRALAIAQTLPESQPVLILTNSPYTEWVYPLLACHPRIHLHGIPISVGVDQTKQIVHATLSQFSPTHLWVDTFPRGLLGELGPFLSKSKCFRTLIHRDINPDYVAKYNLRAFVQQNYDEIWIPGEGQDIAFGDLPNVRLTSPCLIRSPHQRLDPVTIQQQLRLTHAEIDQPLVLLISAGRPEEQAFFEQIIQALNAPDMAISVAYRLISPTPPLHEDPICWLCYYPAMDLISRASIVIGSGGYNTVYECLALGVPLIAKPWARLYDRQLRRLEWAQIQGQVAIVQSVAEVITNLIDQDSLFSN